MSKFLLVCGLIAGLTVGQAFAEAPKPADSKAAKPVAEAKTVKPSTEAAPAGQAELAVKPMSEHAANLFLKDKEGEHFVDPVCGMYQIVGDKTPFETYEGRKYYFCSDACAAKFKADPATYKKSLVIPAKVVSVTDGKITATDPVTKEHVATTDKTPTYDHMGRRFYFSSDSTAKLFAAEPMKYLTAKGMHKQMKDESSAAPSDKPAVVKEKKIEKAMGKKAEEKKSDAKPVAK